MALYDFQQFNATIARGNAKANRFEAWINLPTALGVSRPVQDDLNIRIESVSFPGKNIRTTSNDNIYGPTHEVAQGVTYGEELTVTFLLQNNHHQRLIFNSWQDLIVSPTTYNVSYYNDYISTMEIFQYDEADKRCAGVMVKEVFPKTVNAIELSNTTTNEFIRATVGFSFKEWVPLDIDYASGVYKPYPEYSETTVVRTGAAPFAGGGSGIDSFPSSSRLGASGSDSFPATSRLGGGGGISSFPSSSRPTSRNFVDSFPGREKGIFEDVGKIVNQGLEVRNQVVNAQQKVMAFRNFFKGITKSTNPLGNLGIGGFGGF